MTNDKDREAFEAWAKRKMPHMTLEKDEHDGEYLSGRAHVWYESWLAALAHRDAQVQGVVEALERRANISGQGVPRRQTGERGFDDGRGAIAHQHCQARRPDRQQGDGEAMSEQYLDGPERIYLQGDTPDEGRVWCTVAENNNGGPLDTPYIRADVADALLTRQRGEIERLLRYAPSGECDQCGEPVVEFSVPNEHWNAVMRPRGEHDQEYICLKCWLNASFNHHRTLTRELAEARGERASFKAGDWVSRRDADPFPAPFRIHRISEIDGHPCYKDEHGCEWWFKPAELVRVDAPSTESSQNGTESVHTPARAGEGK